MSNQEVFWPRQVKIVDVWINTAWAFISGVIGSVLLLFIIFAISGIIDVPASFKTVKMSVGGNNPLFPFLLSFITFIVGTIVSVITYYFLTLTDAGKYKRTIIHFSQISFFAILTYIFLAPVYVYAGMQNYDNIMLVFVVHSLLLAFWVTVLLEVMNNYRYILLWLYASFIGLFITGIITFFIFTSFSTGYAKLLSLLFILPLINGFMIFFKWVFEIVYYKYFMLTGNDQLWDIFSQIEQEEMDAYNEAVNQNSNY